MKNARQCSCAREFSLQALIGQTFPRGKIHIINSVSTVYIITATLPRLKLSLWLYVIKNTPRRYIANPFSAVPINHKQNH